MELPSFGEILAILDPFVLNLSFRSWLTILLLPLTWICYPKPLLNKELDELKKFFVISGHGTYKLRMHMILVINDLTLVSLLLLISLFDRPFLTGIPSSCPALLTGPHPIIRIDLTRFCPHSSKSHDGCVTLRATYKSAPSRGRGGSLPLR